VITSWRIVKARRVATAFDGQGARLRGGRWNSPGIAVIYTAQSAALAALETLVRLDRDRPVPEFALIPCHFAEKVVAPVDRSLLPKNWRSYPAPPELQQIGNEWLKRGRSAVLVVPSAIIESESNYLLNPQHKDFALIEIGSPQRFALDLRLLT